MGGHENGWIGTIRNLSIPVVIVAVSWLTFEFVIQPVLVSINPIFADQHVSPTEILIGHAPETPAQVAFFATVLIGLFVAFLLRTLVYEGVNSFIEVLESTHILVAIVPLSIINEFILSKFSIDIWDDEQ